MAEESVYLVLYKDGSGKKTTAEFGSVREVYQLSDKVEKEGGWIKIFNKNDGHLVYETPVKFWREDEDRR